MKSVKGMLKSVLRMVIRRGNKGREQASWPANATLSQLAARRLQRHLEFARRLDAKGLTVIRGEKTASKYPVNIAVAGRL